ncbi:iron-containing alcohol dehydrogenase [Clostridium massiliodielmoense]|uniref:iron-containing alcohol dehydrogenase n=1 Tax=Clostridium massiliodielmoense TaxID=1776385 RepID=UPI00016676DF|nr:iron-containing alcohol dehydrogenase [Clostridium massiliodielmoense]EDS77732.1 1,3-propanediol dehydrogenase [Clostridium botulinum C str. Eklund]KEH97302.1 alcohol dehydrogenase [Clostridium botulinum C/D str. BKT12695]NEZ49169.1 iron-containing alcohol dehydrogenase [Clostridium botulinum]
MAHKIIVPKKIVYGKEALKDAGIYLKEFGKKALIVTDEIMVKIGNVSKVTEILDANDIKYVIYDKVNSEPTDVMVDKGIEIYNAEQCDFLIAVGGGSPIDTMKAIGAMITNPGKISDYMGKIIENCPPPLVAVPTTAGTGSEATQFTIISDTVNNVKMLLKGPNLLPQLAIVDAEMTMTAPKGVTAATGIDALTHAVESYTSRVAQPLSDTFALSAIKRIFNNLRKAYNEGNDFESRNQMSLGSLEAGIAFNNASVTIIHGMSRPIGALFHVPHGISNAMLFVECLKFAIEGAPERFAEIAKVIGSYKEGMTDMEAAQTVVDEISKLCSDINIPTLEEFGIDKEEFFAVMDKMADDALASGSPNNTMRQPSKEEIIEIYKRLWK